MRAIINAFKHEKISNMSLKEKGEALKELNKTHSIRQISELIDEPISTVYYWINGRKEDIEKNSNNLKEWKEKAEKYDKLSVGIRHRTSVIRKVKRLDNLTTIINFLKNFTPKTLKSKNKVHLISVVAMDCIKRYGK